MSSHWLRSTVLTLAAVALPHAVSHADEASEPSWRLAPWLSRELAAQAEAYRAHRTGFTSLEEIRSTRYRDDERKRALPYGPPLPGLPYDDESSPEFRLRTERTGSRQKRAPGKLKRFPSAHDWAMLFSAENQPFFMCREIGIRLEGFDLIREIRFRGALPFTDGRDIREWEGVALVDAARFRVIEIRARPGNQAARLRWLFERWSRSFKITIGISAGPFFIPGLSIRFARRPLAYRCFVRFDDRKKNVWLPTLMSQEIRLAVSRERTVLRLLSTRRYVHTPVDSGLDVGRRDELPFRNVAYGS
jgi:hypothetical protein